MNAILGCAYNYNWDVLWPFVCSTPAKKILFTGGKTSRLTHALLEEHDVWVAPCFLETGLPPFVSDYLHDKARLARFKLPKMKIVLSRFAAMWAFLEAHCQEFDYVLLTDTRDVISTGDVFDFPWPTDKVSLFREWDKMTLGTCPYNRAALLSAYNAQVVEEMKGLPIICSGTILGPVRLIQNFLELMLHEFATFDCTRQGILDQAVVNVLAYRRPELVQVYNANESAIRTIGYYPQTPDLTGAKFAHQGDRNWHKPTWDRLMEAI
jgi:hypothetical protein